MYWLWLCFWSPPQHFGQKIRPSWIYSMEAENIQLIKMLNGRLWNQMTFFLLLVSFDTPLPPHKHTTHAHTHTLPGSLLKLPPLSCSLQKKISLTFRSTHNHTTYLLLSGLTMKLAPLRLTTYASDHKKSLIKAHIKQYIFRITDVLLQYIFIYWFLQILDIEIISLTFL